jgi:hypothetical protein
MMAFANDQRSFGNVKRRNQFGIRRALNAVVGPKNLLTIGKLYRFKRLPAGMTAGKRNMRRGVPILRDNYIFKKLSQLVDDRNTGLRQLPLSNPP